MQFLLVQLLATVLVNAAVALITGALATQLWLSLSDEGAWQDLQARLEGATGIGLLASITGTLLSLWQASATMADVALFDSGPALWVLFADTAYGRFALTVLLLLTAASGLHFTLGRHRRSRGYLVAMLAMLVAVAACRVATGHAAESGVISVAAAVEFTHIVAMAMWFGVVIVAAWIVLPPMGRMPAPGNIAAYLACLSSLATAALAAVLASGLYNAFRVLNTPAEVVSTGYGWILLTKLCCVAIAMALGGWNRFIGFPAMLAEIDLQPRNSARFRAVRTVLRVESVVLLIVLLAAAVLTTNVPPASS